MGFSGVLALGQPTKSWKINAVAAASILLAGCAGAKHAPGESAFLVTVPNDGTENFLETESFALDDEPDAATFIENRLEALRRLVTTNIDPYTGRDSTPKACRLESLPAPSIKKNERTMILVFHLFSSKSRVLGVCTSPQAVTKTQYLVLYCGEKAVQVVKYFYPATAPWLESPVARCRESGAT